jgi:alpha-D-ribose 1-methylphosphonate 5-triphosphate synthase subunit PhnG
MSPHQHALNQDLPPQFRLDDLQRVELLSTVAAQDITELGEELIVRLGDPHIITAPEVGLVMMEIREPVCEERFHLGEVVVTRAEVHFADQVGWAMRIGTDKVATLAAAICDAVGASDRPERDLVDQLCVRHAQQLSLSRNDEWAELSTTEVRFEEMD